jgi:hypothetical protein
MRLKVDAKLKSLHIYGNANNHKVNDYINKFFIRFLSIKVQEIGI